ncbi:hypothetical protein BH11MYX1_BH11MYX1_39470 [soil metagenome]
MRSSLLLVALPLALGCSAGSGHQVISGRIAPGFPAQVTTVNVLHGRQIVASSRVAADGSFSLSVPPGANLSLRLVASGQAGVVFPRGSGSVDSTFAIKAAGVAFDLGNVRYVGAASTTSFSFHDGGSAAECDAEEHDGNGATCIDDGDHQDNQCGDGQDGATQDGAGDGSGADAESETADAPDAGDAVAEHNFPADGCADGSDNGGDDGTDNASDSGSNAETGT